MKFNKLEAEHEIVTLKLTHTFALKMAMLICFSIMASIMSLGIFFGTKSLYGFVFLGVITIVAGLTSFRITRSAII